MKQNPREHISFSVPDDADAISERLNDVANTLREAVASGVLPPDDVKDHIGFLSAFAAEHSRTTFRLPSARQKQLEELVDVVLLSRDLKATESLPHTLRKAIQLTAPSWLNDLMQKRLDQDTAKGKISARTIIRARQMMDMSFALLVRETVMSRGSLQGADSVAGPFYYLWSDASPQCGREWLLSQTHIWRGRSKDDMLQVVRAVNALAVVSGELWGQFFREAEQAPELSGSNSLKQLEDKVSEEKTLTADTGFELSDVSASVHWVRRSVQIAPPPQKSCSHRSSPQKKPYQQVWQCNILCF